jgi:diadenosine tetraphosphatase ApaH/serine/threonine PP2A family protein phosphatase
MRYLVLSDIHANLEALEAVIAVAGEVDGTIFLGDLVGYGPNPNECAALLTALPRLTGVIGNHDLAALGGLDLETFNTQARAAAEWTQVEMNGATRDYLQALGQVEEFETYTAVHGSPADPVWEYLESRSQAPASFARFITSVCFNGHTHVPRVFTQTPETKEIDVFVPTPTLTLGLTDGVRRIVNPGSVGQPRDGDPRAAFGTLDATTGEFQFRRVEYDIATTQSKITEAGLPEDLAVRLMHGL